jgi:hypothetical protein
VGAHEGHGNRRSRLPTGRTRARVDHTQPGGAIKRKTRRERLVILSSVAVFSGFFFSFSVLLLMRGWAAGLRCGKVGRPRRLVRLCDVGGKWVGLAAVGSDGCDGLKLFFSSFFLEEQKEEKSR